MQAWIDHITVLTGLDQPVQLKLYYSVLTVLIIFTVIFLLRRIIWRRSEDVRVRYTSYKILTYAGYFFGIIILGRIWITGTHSLITYLGLLSAGVAIALQDVIANLAGWIFIWIRRPFKVGERVQVGDSIGDVIDIGLFQFSLLEIGNWVDADQSTGRIIHVPNKDVLSKVTANYVSGFEHIWDEIPVLITFESDWRKAKQILTEVVTKNAQDALNQARRSIQESSRQYMIRYSKLTPIVFTNVKDSGVLLTMRYLCLPKRRRTTREMMWEDILDEFAKHKDIDLAYPTRRVFDNLSEGKQAIHPTTTTHDSPR
ncbi:MAG: mechanosensitive ion channel [Bdellovibrionales bacterium]|nr:mechanosensitive ion channel [Bdellovibrionales bacterium]